MLALVISCLHMHVTVCAGAALVVFKTHPVLKLRKQLALASGPQESRGSLCVQVLLCNCGLRM